MAVPALLLLSVLFLITALTFVPIGQLCGRLMERRRNLRAYGLNLLGSIVGVFLMFQAVVRSHRLPRVLVLYPDDITAPRAGNAGEHCGRSPACRSCKE